MTIDVEKLNALVAKADQIFIAPEGEAVLLKLLEVQEQLNLAIDAAKKKLEEAALKLDPNFRSIQADNVKVYYREYGTKFKIDESLVSQVPKELYSVETKYKVDGRAVEKWVDQHKGLPLGIQETERTKQISFTLKRGGEKDE